MFELPKIKLIGGSHFWAGLRMVAVTDLRDLAVMAKTNLICRQSKCKYS